MMSVCRVLADTGEMKARVTCCEFVSRLLLYKAEPPQPLYKGTRLACSVSQISCAVPCAPHEQQQYAVQPDMHLPQPDKRLFGSNDSVTICYNHVVNICNSSLQSPH